MKKLYSTHIFILPFKILEGSDKDIKKYLLVDSNFWTEYQPTLANDSNSQKENSDGVTDKTIEKDMLKYFTKYAKESLFKCGEKTSESTTELYNRLVGEKEDTENFDLEVHIKDFRNKSEIIKLFNLSLESVKVKFFDTSVGTISFTVNNYNYPDIEDVLLINTQARNIYLAYKNQDYSIIRINLNGEKIEENILEAQLKYEDGKELITNKIIGHFLHLNRIEPILDNRMYTICHYLESSLENSFDKFEKYKKELKLKENWYNFIFVDKSGDKTCQDDEMESKLLNEATYTRWSKYGTYYGVSRYSFVLWTNDSDFSKDVLNRHMKIIYFQLISFAIAQKATIIELNEKINNILNSCIKHSEDKNEYQQYLTYLAKLSFKEITCQEQGIELYNLCRKQMGLEELTDELDLKIKTLNERAEKIKAERELENAEILNRSVNRLSLFSVILGVIFGALSTIGGILSINEKYYKNNFDEKTLYYYLVLFFEKYSYIWVGIIFFLIVIAIFLFTTRRRK